MELWNKNTEIEFFKRAEGLTSLEKLFYRTYDGKLVAYWPKGYPEAKTTLQSRNSLIGNFTEKWTKDLITKCVAENGYYAIQSAVCEELSLPKNSCGDVVISKKDNLKLVPDDILIIFEVKMSIVWNWQYENSNYKCIGDYRSHQGNLVY